MIIGRQEDVTAAAASVMERTSDPRLREIMGSLVKHLHGFVRDVRLTEAEFREATAMLAELGKQSTDTHNEVVLMAGSLGVSSLVCLLNNGDDGNTETFEAFSSLRRQFRRIVIHHAIRGFDQNYFGKVWVYASKIAF